MESISRISSVLETARDLTLEAAQSASSARGVRSTAGGGKNMPVAQLRKLLDSRNDREVLDGLRRVISMMYRSQPCLPLFSSVVKNVASPNIEIKKLVYIYLLHHAEAEPDLALLSINTIQKSLADQNPQVRALALRVMSGIRVPVISQIVSLAIKRGAGDMSPYVRKAAALATPKCFRLDPATEPQLTDYVDGLLGDRQYFVAGAAAAAFLDICSDRIDLVHKHYRSLIRKLVDMDEWGQMATLQLLTVYGRKCFPKKTRRQTKNTLKGFYEDDDQVQEGNETENGEEIQVLDPDLELLLKACRPLLQSRNSGVIVAVTRCYAALGTPEYLDLTAGPLISLLRSSHDIQHVALYNLVCVCLDRPEAFVKYASRFFLRHDDTPQSQPLKLELLTIIFPYCASHMKGIILSELEHFSRVSNKDLVRESVRAIGRCAQNDPQTSARCLRLLFKQISSPDPNLVAESLTVIRHLIQQDPSSHSRTVIHLAKHLDTATSPQARASIIWLVGEFAGVDGANNIAADVLRLLCKSFADESEPAKLQVVLLAAKVYLHHLNREQQQQEDKQTETPESKEPEIEAQDPLDHAASEAVKEHQISLLWRYILLLARYDTSYDLRDRARMYKALLATPTSTQLANLLLLAPKPVPHTPSPSEGRKDFTLGSTSLVIGEQAGLTGFRGYEPLPEQVQEGREPDPALRNEAHGKTTADFDDKRQAPAGQRLDSAAASASRQSNNMQTSITTESGPTMASTPPIKEVSLDDWLAESESGEEEETDDDETSGETEEETDEEQSDDNAEHARLVT